MDGTKLYWHFRDRLCLKYFVCYDPQIKHFCRVFVQESLKRMMVSGMTDYLIFQKSQPWMQMGIYCANEYFVCYDPQIKHFCRVFVQESLKRMMVSGMTDYLIFQKSQPWMQMGIYCANEQFGVVRNCYHIMTL